jgi:hypothetical protein
MDTNANAQRQLQLQLHFNPQSECWPERHSQRYSNTQYEPHCDAHRVADFHSDANIKLQREPQCKPKSQYHRNYHFWNADASVSRNRQQRSA